MVMKEREREREREKKSGSEGEEKGRGGFLNKNVQVCKSVHITGHLLQNVLINVALMNKVFKPK
jgi:hypothetical protein